MLKYFLVFLFFPLSLYAQTNSFKGIVFDEKGSAIPYATVALLDKSDSTLAYYAVTNSTGNFEITKINSGEYILQTSFLGYKTNYSKIKFPLENIDGVKAIVMEPMPVNLNAAVVSGERIPLLIRGDTVEYNASSYKTQPDAVTEDLLKKLPGVEVDRNGNIKAQGEDVKKVTVDGKEFFGNDPKIATRNLPADAIDKVQVYDTKSDQAELTGINDGKRDKTINLELKDDTKNAWFGEVQAGGGSDDHYQAGAKAYRFNPSKQFALLGMANNINKFGFSFSDYMNFTGGLKGNGGSFNLSNDNNLPIDFGQTEKGLITSGAVGANYSSEPRKDNRFNVSYLANGVNKKLNQQIATTNFTDAGTFYSDQNSNDDEKDRAHRINFSWKNRIDTMQTFTLNGQTSLSNSSENNSDVISNTSDNVDVSGQYGKNNFSGDIINGNINSSYLKKLQSNWKLFTLGFDGSWRHGFSKNEINTSTNYFSPPAEFTLNQIQRNTNDLYNYSFEGGITRKIGAFNYMEGKISVGREDENYSRQQGLVPESNGVIDSLSDELKKYSQYLEPQLSFKRILEKSQLKLSLAAHALEVNNKITGNQDYDFQKIYFLPGIRWEDEYKRSHRLILAYESEVVTPQASEFFPLTNYQDPLNRTSGNQNLIPELHNDFRAHWSVFDQFSFTSIFAGLQFSYIKNKISWGKTIDDKLNQHITLMNVPEEYQSSLSGEYTRPIKKLGVNVTFNLDERWSRTLSYINDLLNTNSNLSHEIGVTFENRKKNKFDVSAGLTFKYDRSLYTLPGADRQNYIKGNAFSDVNFNPNDSWHFSVKADLSHFYGMAFNDNVRIPLLQAEASYLFLKHKRGTLTLTGFDLLNRNTGIERTSEYNYLMENRSDIIQRYVMLTFKYKLNKFNSEDKIDVKVNGH